MSCGFSGLGEEKAEDRDKENGAMKAQMAFRSPVPLVALKAGRGWGGQHSAAALTRTHSPAFPVSSSVFVWGITQPSRLCFSYPENPETSTSP